MISGLSGFALAGLPSSPEWPFPLRMRGWDSGNGQLGSCGDCECVGGRVQPPGDGSEIGIFPFFGEHLHRAEPGGWVLAQVAKHEGFTCGQLV